MKQKYYTLRNLYSDICRYREFVDGFLISHKFFLLTPNCYYPLICTLVSGQGPPLWVTSFHFHCGSQAHWHSRTVDSSFPVAQNKPVLLMLLTMSLVSPPLLSAAKATLWLMVCWPKLWCHTVWKLETRIYYWKFFIGERELVIHVLSCGSQAGRRSPRSAQMLLPAAPRASTIPLPSSALQWKSFTGAWGQFVLWLLQFLVNLPMLLLLQGFSILICNFTKAWLSPRCLFDVMLPGSDAELLGFVSVLDLLQ